MSFGYLIGVAVFGILYCLGRKIFNFLDPKPGECPKEKCLDLPPVPCNLIINGNSFASIKTEHIREDYYYNMDYDILKHTAIHKKYALDRMICDNDMIDKSCMFCEVNEGEKTIKCYATTDRKMLISCEPEMEERVYSYRKPFRRKKISA